MHKLSLKKKYKALIKYHQKKEKKIGWAVTKRYFGNIWTGSYIHSSNEKPIGLERVSVLCFSTVPFDFEFDIIRNFKFPFESKPKKLRRDA